MINEILLKEINRCGKSRYKISVDTEINESALSRFVNGQRGLSVDSADILLKYFGYELIKLRAKK